MRRRRPEEFEKLVRNERPHRTRFEGQRFYDLRRWATDATALNGSVSKPVISAAQINRVEVEKRSYQSLWVPIPYTEMIRHGKDGAERRMVQLGIKNNAL